MLMSFPTKYGAGMKLYGDYWDLKNLHETIHVLCEGPFEARIYEYVLALAYEIRHAFQGDREEKSFGRDEYDAVKYRGCALLWPHLLAQTGLLRAFASMRPTTLKIQGNLYLLEHCIQDSLTAYDPLIGPQCFGFIRSYSIIMGGPYHTQYFDICARKYVCEGKPGKARFKRLPGILHMIHPASQEYHSFSLALEGMAKEQKRKLEEFADYSAWPDFKW